MVRLEVGKNYQLPNGAVYKYVGKLNKKVHVFNPEGFSDVFTTFADEYVHSLKEYHEPRPDVEILKDAVSYLRALKKNRKFRGDSTDRLDELIQEVKEMLTRMKGE